MIYFFALLILFLILLSYLAFALSFILKRRGAVEEQEYILKNTYGRRYSFALGAIQYLEKEDGDSILEKREKASKKVSLQEVYSANLELEEALESAKLSDKDRIEHQMLKQELKKKVDRYNQATEYFNNGVFGAAIRPVAKICKLKPFEKIQ